MTGKSDHSLLIKVKIIPNSSKNDIIIEDDCIKVKVTAQPVENKANKALVELLAKKIKLAKSNIEIIKGLTSKEKTIMLTLPDDKRQKEIKAILNMEEGV